eukprot:6781097-Pyramimonas_sp.AAC.1
MRAWLRTISLWPPSGLGRLTISLRRRSEGHRKCSSRTSNIWAKLLRASSDKCSSAKGGLRGGPEAATREECRMACR